jgi:hypothetical protein
MALDPRIPMMAQGFTMAPQSNALAKLMGLEHMANQNALAQAQLQEYQAQAQQKQQAQQRYQEYLNSVQSPQIQASQQAMGAGGGPTTANASQMSRVDPRAQSAYGMLKAGIMSPGDYFKIAYPDVEVKDYKAIRSPDGSVSYVGMTKDGRVINTGQQPFEKPEVRSFGNFMGGVDPITGKVQNYGAMGQTPESVASNATAMRGQNMTDARARESLAQADSHFRTQQGTASKPASGYEVDASSTPGNTVWKPVKGGPADIKQQGMLTQDTSSLNSSTNSMDRLAIAANEVLNSPGLPGVYGLRGAVPNIPGSDAANAAALLNTLKSQVGFGVLQEMRNNSKTGGALGAVSDKENAMLQANLAALEKAQSVEQAKLSLKKIVDYAQGAKDRLRQAYNMKHGGGAQTETERPKTVNFADLK